jgi:hypothetical protein
MDEVTQNVYCSTSQTYLSAVICTNWSEVQLGHLRFVTSVLSSGVWRRVILYELNRCYVPHSVYRLSPRNWWINQLAALTPPPPETMADDISRLHLLKNNSHFQNIGLPKFMFALTQTPPFPTNSLEQHYCFLLSQYFYVWRNRLQ